MPAVSSIIAAVWRSMCMDDALWIAASGTRRLRGADVFGEAPFDRVAGEWSAGAGGEQRVGWLAVALARPDLEHGDGLAGERGDALFASFAQGPQVRAGTELHVGVGQPSSSETRRPVCTAQSNSAWSRRPAQVDRSGLSRSALTSSGVRNVTIRFSERLVGIASTRWIRPACSGCLSAQY